jgi:GH24 family phage-related lysozyme (muramidase)
LIKHFEGFEATAYKDAVGVPTIGYGHTRTVSHADVRNGRTITMDEAEVLLREDCASAEADVERLIDVPLNDNEFAALVSFTFNLGGGALKRSTLRRKLNGGDRDAVPSEMARWVRAGGRTLRGLVRRRNAEARLFVTPVEESVDEEAPVSTEDVARRVEVVDVDESSVDCIGRGYLSDSDVVMERGSVDDSGAAAYDYLSQNVPDGYVVALQQDLVALGFGGGLKVDGAFGVNTLHAVRAFEHAAGLAADGLVDSSTRQAIALWLKEGYTRETPPGGDDDRVELLPGGLRMISPRVPHFSQGDRRWGQRVLGRSSSLSKEGCAITCIAMVLRFYGRDADPGSLDIFLDANNGYVGNSVKWGVADNFKQAGRQKLAYHRKTGSEAELTETLRQRIADNRPTLARVDYGIDRGIVYNHFVVAVGVTEDGDIVMNDPATRHGDGYEYPGPANIIQKTSRKQGYRIVQLDYYDPLD